MQCSGADADDFEQVVYVAFLERDIMAQVDRAKNPLAFLYVVVANLFRDFRIQRWGKWRPSAKAVRLGEDAVRLERLVHHQDLSLAQAVDVLAADARTGATRAELEAIAGELPPRIGRYEVGESAMDCLAAPSSTDQLVIESESRTRRRDILGRLAATIAELDDEDRTLLRLRFWEGVSVARLSRMSGVPQRALYARFDHLRDELRKRLLSAGLAEAEVHEMFAAWQGPLDPGDSLDS